MPSRKYCIVPKCNSTSIKTPNKLFLSVPKNAKIRKKWCRVMKRDALSNKSGLYCCEDHFNLQEDMDNYVKYNLVGGPIVLKKGVIPHKFVCQKETTELITKPAYAKRRRIEFYEKVLSANIPSCSSQEPIQFIDCSHNDETRIVEIDPIATLSDNGVQNNGTTNKVKTKGVQVNIKTKTKHKSTNTIRTKKHTQTNASEVKNAGNYPIMKRVIYKSSSSSNDIVSIFESDKTISEYSFINFNNHMQKGILMSISREPKLLLGLPRDSYDSIKLLSETIKVPDIHIMLTLKKIRLNQCYSLIGLHFGMSKSYVAKVVRDVLPLIASCMKDLIIFPSNNKIHLNLPLPFRYRYNKVQSIIDCFEVQIEKPSNAVEQALSWSSYKGCNTVKYMISITPDGLINYISEGYSGRVTDSAIFEDCDYLEKLPPGAVVLTDRGFKNVAHLLEQNKCTLLRPPSVLKNTVPTKEEVHATKRIAALRVHVERTIGRLREFGFLRPHACIDSHQINMLDYIVITACGIVNIQRPLFKE